VEYAKAEKEVIKEIANNAEENVKGIGKWIEVFLKNFGIDKIVEKIMHMCNFLFGCVVSLCLKICYCCNMRKTEKQKVLPPKEDTKRTVTPTKRTRARSKSPARKSKSK
jgi:hypothetical protein